MKIIITILLIACTAILRGQQDTTYSYDILTDGYIVTGSITGNLTCDTLINQLYTNIDELYTTIGKQNQEIESLNGRNLGLSMDNRIFYNIIEKNNGVELKYIKKTKKLSTINWILGSLVVILSGGIILK